MSCVCNSHGSYCEYIDGTCYYILKLMLPNQDTCAPDYDCGPFSSFHVPIPDDEK